MKAIETIKTMCTYVLREVYMYVYGEFRFMQVASRFKKREKYRNHVYLQYLPMLSYLVWKI